MNELQWKGDYTMEDFVPKFCRRTPVLAKTLTGTLGCDELHVLSKDEVLCFIIIYILGGCGISVHVGLKAH